MTTGPTSEQEPVTAHRVELVEHHTITMPSLSANPHAAWALAREAALRWAEREGLEIANVFALSGSSAGSDGPGPAFYGVSFDVHVGHAENDAWTWSSRIEALKGRLIDTTRAKLASVTRLGTEAAREWKGPEALTGVVAPADQRPPWLKRAEGWDEDGQ